jgi:2-iminoacetate synthase ThiH
MAGSEEGNPVISSNEISSLIRQAGFIPVERDSLYKAIHHKKQTV